MRHMQIPKVRLSCEVKDNANSMYVWHHGKVLVIFSRRIEEGELGKAYREQIGWPSDSL